jgi:hypothetical protein
MEKLREIIRKIIAETLFSEKEELLIEPDETEGEEEEEVSSGGVAGVSTPLGAGPTYPSKSTRPKKLKSLIDSAASSFGGAKIVRKNK